MGFTFGNSVALSLTYDQDYELSTLQSGLGTTTIQNLSYGYDSAGNITSITDNYQSARSQTLGYDDLNRLNLASGTYGSLSFTYDGVGNRTTLVSGGTTQTYNYGSTSNQLASISVSGTHDAQLHVREYGSGFSGRAWWLNDLHLHLQQ